MKIKFIVEKLEKKDYEYSQLNGIWYIVRPQHKILDVIDKIFPIYGLLGITKYTPCKTLEEAKRIAKSKTEGKTNKEKNHGTIYDPTIKILKKKDKEVN